MSKPKHTLTEADKQEIITKLAGSDEELERHLKRISATVRALEGRSPEPSMIIQRLTNPLNILERSRFPTYPTIANQVYLRLGHEVYGSIAQAAEDLANKQAEGFISYKGGSREEWTEQVRASGAPPEAQNFFFSQGIGQPQQQPQKQKRRLWRRSPKEESEFDHK